jgi:hypothetical protein
VNFAAAEAALRAAFDAQWPGRQPSVKYVYDNGAPIAPKPTPLESWARITMLDGLAQLPEVGSPVSWGWGRLIVQLFVPLGGGAAGARALADSVAGIFQSKLLGGVHCYEAALIPVGSPAGAVWWQLNVATRFRFENAPA